MPRGLDEAGGQEHLLVGLAARGHEPELRAGMRLENLRGNADGGAPFDGLALDSGALEAAFVADVFKIQAMGIREPDAVHIVVFARGDAIDFVLAGADGDVGAGGAIHVDRFDFLQKPDRILNRKSLEVSAPTGQISTVFSV